jgi:hypothetical protein
VPASRRHSSTRPGHSAPFGPRTQQCRRVAVPRVGRAASSDGFVRTESRRFMPPAIGRAWHGSNLCSICSLVELWLLGPEVLFAHMRPNPSQQVRLGWRRREVRACSECDERVSDASGAVEAPLITVDDDVWGPPPISCPRDASRCCVVKSRACANL